MGYSVIVLGAGGHANVLIDTLQLMGCEITGITVPKNTNSSKYRGYSIIGDDDSILNYPTDDVKLVNGLGSIGSPVVRAKIFKNMKEKGYTFLQVIHPSAIIASDVTLSEGVQVMAGSIIQPGSFIGENSIVNTKVSIDHDCKIGSNVHIAPGVTISGGVEIGDNVHIGTGAVIIQGIKIGENSIVGAGSVCVKDIEKNQTVMGVPAKAKEVF